MLCRFKGSSCTLQVLNHCGYGEVVLVEEGIDAIAGNREVFAEVVGNAIAHHLG